MKKIILLISICISISLTAQNPQGKLFVHTQKSSINEKDVFGFVQYPSLQYYTIDSTELTDMMIYNDKIYIANNDVGIYSIQTNQKIDSIINTDARQICNWNDKLIITSHTQPYFRVYDIINNHNLEYVIDTLKIKYIPTDIIVSGNWAVMTIDTNLVIVD
ncbi:MAG: hypothetical protein K8S00_10115, partial [Bacteroidales bacterium]|nr:hypothetical protein [Bacteroidales bacterium]